LTLSHVHSTRCSPEGVGNASRDTGVPGRSPHHHGFLRPTTRRYWLFRLTLQTRVPVGPPPLAPTPHRVASVGSARLSEAESRPQSGYLDLGPRPLRFCGWALRPPPQVPYLAWGQWGCPAPHSCRARPGAAILPPTTITRFTQILPPPNKVRLTHTRTGVHPFSLDSPSETRPPGHNLSQFVYETAPQRHDLCHIFVYEIAPQRHDYFINKDVTNAPQRD
jgi:hypothetical protein